MARKKKKKISIRKISIFIVSIIIIISTITVALNYTNIKNSYLSKKTGYQKETIEVFFENDIYNIIENHKYSKTLEEIINTEYYNEKYLENYIEITYKENENFLDYTNKLLDKGYNSDDINNIYDNLTDESINILINNNYMKDIINLISINYFNENFLERYIKYYEKTELDIETSILHVNIGLDNPYYTNINSIEKQDDILVLVNKYNKLQNSYVPKDLEQVSYGTGKLRKEAKIAFDKMCAASRKDGISIHGGSGYRSYSHQLNLYNNYVAVDGKTEADTYSARAGHSEHQTGLAMDILNNSWNFIAETDKEYTWLVNNSYKYGFILRYPKGKEKITGYMYEPWHYRYIGVDLATEIHKLGITYEEYIAKK